MTQVLAKANFDHDKPKRPGDLFEVSPQAAKQLERKGLVEIIGDGPAVENPTTSAGASSSASPADQASPEATAEKSKGGGRKKKADAQSS